MMAAAALSFVFLYAILWLFERKHSQLDRLLVVIAVLVPILLEVIIRLGNFFVGLSNIALWTATVGMLIATYLMLNRVLGVSPKRSVAYTVALFVFQQIPGFFMGAGRRRSLNTRMSLPDWHETFSCAS